MAFELDYSNLGTVLTLLEATGTTGTKKSCKIRMPSDIMVWQTITTGAPDSISIKIQGSLDDTNWVDLDSSTNVDGEVRCISNKPVKYVRIVLTTLTDALSPMATVAVKFMIPVKV